MAKPELCSLCFSDRGLQLEAEKIGRKNQSTCPNCGSSSGVKLYKKHLEPLLHEFFWNGSFARTDFGGAPRLVSNPFRYSGREVKFPDWLERDAHLLEDRLEVGIFHYGPPLWRIGEIEPLVALRQSETRLIKTKEIISRFSERILDEGSTFYRVRLNLDKFQETDHSQYDAPPEPRKNYGRLDSAKLAVLYGSEDLEICIHECRVQIPDECFVATLRTNCDLRLLNLAADLEDEGGTEFESISLAIRYLFSAEAHSYEITRAIAIAAHEEGYDGILAPSYFSLVKPNRAANIALFGHPIRESKLKIDCINRAALKAASYEVRMGPIFS